MLLPCIARSHGPFRQALCTPGVSQQALDTGRRILELCDNCWCRGKRACTVAPPYGVCLRCMDSWGSCDVAQSHYLYSDPAHLGIRAACDKKKPVRGCALARGAARLAR